MAAKDKFKQMFGRKTSSDNPLTGHKRYTKIRTLGQGSYGVVLLAVDNQTREKVNASPQISQVVRLCVDFLASSQGTMRDLSLKSPVVHKLSVVPCNAR